jgi:hypothetical protein
MLQLQTNGNFATGATYAQSRNARFNSTKSQVRSIKQRWDETYNSLPPHQQSTIDYALEQAKAEFRRRNPNIKSWNQLPLAEAKSVLMKAIKIDGTMQRQLDIFWVLALLNKFMATMVVPIQVYRPNADIEEYLAWDGQHTLVLLWLISTMIFEQDFDTIIVPVNLYQSSLKAEMRTNFISLNTKEGKKVLELIDIWDQQVFGVRVDGSTNPVWVENEKKQAMLEKHGMFVTARKFGDDDQPYAISRLQEINKISVESVDYLAHYLSIVCNFGDEPRPAGEKEIVMMAHFFDRIRVHNVWSFNDPIVVTPEYIIALASTLNNLFDADFSPNGKFWVKASNAYATWHAVVNHGLGTPKFSKEPVHGFPFLIEQLKKSFEFTVPESDSRSEFTPAPEDLF